MKSDGKISTSGLQVTPSSFKVQRHSAVIESNATKREEIRMFNPQNKPPLQYGQKVPGGALKKKKSHQKKSTATQ